MQHFFLIFLNFFRFFVKQLILHRFKLYYFLYTETFYSRFPIQSLSERIY